MRRTVEVATLTFHRAINYGAVLQTYALQQVIGSLGVESEVFDFRSKPIEESYTKCSANKRSSLASKAKGWLSWMLLTSCRGSRRRGFKSFIEKNIRLSEPVERDGLSEAAKSYSLLIVGSDQIWNPKITKGDAISYLADFAGEDCAKVAYGASIGVGQWDTSFEKAAIPLIQRFSAVSMRESCASEYVRRVCGVDALTVCDPTLLLDRDAWLKVACLPRKRRPYLLVFALGKVPEDMAEWSKALAAMQGLDVVFLHYPALPIPGVKNVRGAGPAEFLGWIAEADMVVTDSYHGCCLSIVLEREFYCFKSAAALESNPHKMDRMEDMFAMLGLDGRFVDTETKPSGLIDYERLRPVKQSYQSSSIAFLKEVLSDVGCR